MFPIDTVSFESLPPSLQREVTRLVNTAETQKDPVFIHLLGIPAAGKSSFARALHKVLPTPSPTLIAFDRIMESMPEYKAETDIVKAFSLYELPARAAGYVVLKTLIEKKADILLDHSGSRPDHVEMLKHAKELGYNIVVVRIVAEKETAKQRIGERQKIEGRFTPLSYVDERESVIESLIGNYKTVAHAYFEVFNGTPCADLGKVFAPECEKVVAVVERLSPSRKALNPVL